MGDFYSRLRAGAVPALLAAAAGVLTLAATREGVALTPDSTHYLSAAGNWLHGKVLMTTITPLEASRLAEPFAAWPPLYPWLIAFLQTFMDPLVGIRWMHAALAAWFILAAHGLAESIMPKHWAAVAAGVLVAQTWWLFAAMFVWSELLFIALTTSSIWFWSSGVRRNSLGWLILAGLSAGLAGVTRYAGGVWIVVGSLSLLMLLPGSARSRYLSRLPAFLIPAAAAPLVWLWINFEATGYWFGQSRPAGWFAPDRVLWDTWWTLSTDWLAPSLRLTESWRTLPLAAAGLGLLVLTFALFKSRRLWRVPKLAEQETSLVLWAYGLSYIGVMIAVITRVGLDPVNPRYLLPAYPALIIACVHLIHAASGADRRAAPDLVPVWLGLALLAAPQAAGSAGLLSRAGQATRDLTAPYWTSTQRTVPQDPVFREVLALSYAGHAVVSNQWEAVSLATGLPVKPLPRRSHPQLENLLRLHPSALVVIRTDSRPERTHDSELQRMTGNGLRYITSVGGHWNIYRVEGAGGEPYARTR